MANQKDSPWTNGKTPLLPRHILAEDLYLYKLGIPNEVDGYKMSYFTLSYRHNRFWRPLPPLAIAGTTIQSFYSLIGTGVSTRNNKELVGNDFFETEKIKSKDYLNDIDKDGKANYLGLSLAYYPGGIEGYVDDKCKFDNNCK